MDTIRQRGQEWRGRLLSLREAIGELYAAEGDALSRDLATWGRRFAVAALLLLAAAAIGFWLILVMIGLLVAVLSIWLEVWAATLITTVVLLLTVGTLALVGWKRLKALEGPLARVQRRWRDHLDWWQERVFDAPLETEDDREGA
jgi:hypothetical protein